MLRGGCFNYIKVVLLILSITSSWILSAQGLDRSVIPSPGEPPEIKLGKTESFTLENGLKVFVVTYDKLPKVAYSLMLDLDPILEREKMGYIDIAGRLMRTGTENRTKQEIDEEIDFMGARFHTSYSSIYASSLKKHQENLLEIVSDVIMNVKFNQLELDKIKKQRISAITSSKDSPDAIARNVGSRLCFGMNHPYGEIITEETVERVNLEDCNRFYQTYFKPNIAYLAVVGDITKEEAIPLVKKHFGKWERGDVPSNKYEVPALFEKRKYAFVHKEGAVQSVINIGYPLDLRPDNPDLIKARVMNTILGGGSTARLYKNLRERNGYTYGAYSSLSSDKVIGRFNARAKVRNEVTDSAITEFFNELDRIINEEVGEEELQNVKNYMTGTFAYSLQDPRTIARFAINQDRYGLPSDFYANYLKNLASVSCSDIQQMARKYVRPDNTLVLVVGDKSSASGRVMDVAGDEEVEFYDHYGNVREDGTLLPVPVGVDIDKVMDMFVKAKYGLPRGKELNEKLNQVKDLTKRMHSSVQGQTIDIVHYKKSPNKIAMIMTLGDLVIQKQTFDGKEGRMSGMQGDKVIQGDALEELRRSAEMHRDVNYEKLGVVLKLLGVEKVKGEDAFKVERENKNGSKEANWYNVNTNLLVKTMSTQESDQGVINVISYYSDYRVVEGIKYAHKIDQVLGGQNLNMEVKSIEVNTDLNDDFFK